MMRNGAAVAVLSRASTKEANVKPIMSNDRALSMFV